MSGWFFVVASALCSILIAHFLKVTGHKGLNVIRVLTVNYAVASVVAFSTIALAFIGSTGTDVSSPESASLFQAHIVDGNVLLSGISSLILILITGLLFIGNFFLFSRSVTRNGLGISVAAMRLSLLIPVTVSVFIYGEWLGLRQWVAMGAIFVALGLLLPRGQQMPSTRGKKDRGIALTGGALLLVLLFVGNGMADTSLKVYESGLAHLFSKEFFMGGVFLTALCAGGAVLVKRGELRFEVSEIRLGVMIGVPNLYASIFLMEALERLPGAMVYAMANSLVVVGAAVLGVKRWGDRVTGRQWAGMLLTVGALSLAFSS